MSPERFMSGREVTCFLLYRNHCCEHPRAQSLRICHPVSAMCTEAESLGSKCGSHSAAHGPIVLKMQVSSYPPGLWQFLACLWVPISVSCVHTSPQPPL